MTRRSVSYSDGFVAQARALFPPIPTEGRPTFAEFETRILRPVSRLALADFDSWGLATDSGPVRVFLTAPAGPFHPLVLYAALVGDPKHVEFLSVEYDEDYPDLLSLDPDAL